MKKGAKKPVIRFSGFTNEWEQQKVANLFEITRGYVLAVNKTTEEKTNKNRYPVYSSQTLNNGLLGYYHEYLYEDTITWTTDGANAGTVNFRSGKFYCTNVCGVLLSKKVKADKMIAEALNNVAKSYVSYAGNPKLMNNVMAGVEIMIPTNEEEREKISNIFATLDHLVTLHQLKLEKIKNIKESLLEKMFPKNNADKPQIRFKGYTYAWERQSLKELCSITTGKSNTQDQDSNGKYPFYIRSEIVAKSNKFLYDCEAVITIGDGNIGRVFHYVNGKFDLHQRCYKMADFNTVTGKYFYYFFSTKFYDRAMRMTAKATVDSVRLDTIADMEIACPKEVTEQNKISLFLDKFEDLLAFHQRKCEKLQNIKEAILEKMFC
ncbi:restriction endonuclease subunit S [Mycoplasmoides gallisepticum]|uniref:restriction endonuclease subunit S n=1 Tax=Mycoplasmoides gallisepticum TaxID=2096 RepID=UPI00334D912F